MDKKKLMVLGMHRSGTSMLAQWLSACGFDLGDKLQGKTASNKFGHFEDSEFYHLHRILLKQNNRDFLVTDKINYKISPKMKEEAQKMVEKRSHLPQWGWKEPRTCLFLPLWDELLPDAYSIVIYRNYNEVVDSLYKRESAIDKKFRKRQIVNRIFKYISYNLLKKHHYNQFLKVWILYNRELLNYIELKGLKNILIFDVDELIQQDDMIFNKLTEWGFKLNKVPISEIFSKNAMQRNFSWGYYDKFLEQEANDVLTAFKRLKNQQ